MSYDTDALVTLGHLKTAVTRASTKRASVQVTAAGWNASTKQQTVTVPGVLADESLQLIQTIPAISSRSAYNGNGVDCIAQGANSLTFSCSSIPSVDMTVYVLVNEVTDLA